MTTKRKQILKAIAVSGSATMDDLVMTTGLERKNLHDNVKATLKEDLCQRIKDDVTGQPAYKLTPKGRAWLENDKDDSSSGRPQAKVGKNIASKDTGSIVDGGSIGADSLPVGNAVSAPPKPDETPVAAGADVKAAPVVQDSLTTEMPTDKECCNAAAVVATTAGAEVTALNKQLVAKDEWIDAAKEKLALAEQQRDDYQRLFNSTISDLASINVAFGLDPNDGGADPIISAIADQRAKLEESERLNIQWLGLAREFNAEGIDGLRNLMKQAIDAERQWEVAMMAAIGEDGTGSVTEAIAGLKETIKQQRAAIDAKDTELGINDLAITGWFDLAKEFKCDSLPEMRLLVTSMAAQVDSLRLAKAENTALKILNTEMPGFGSVHKALSGRGYLVRAPKKAPRIFSKRSNAEAAAMASAKQRGTVNVFALVPVGKAVRGAEWRDA